MFLIGRMLHLSFDRLVAGHGGMSLVQALGRDLAGVIDTHQAGGVRFLRVRQVGFSDTVSRIRPCRPACRGGDRPERRVQSGKQPIERG